MYNTYQVYHTYHIYQAEKYTYLIIVQKYMKDELFTEEILKEEPFTEEILVPVKSVIVNTVAKIFNDD